MTLFSRAWMLDVAAYQRELGELGRAGEGPEADLALRERAVQVWRSRDPIVRAYLEVVPTGTPDDWEAGLEEAQVVDWYRVAMAPYLVPSRGFHSAELLKRRLPDLGWSPSEARRLAFGRGLASLAEAHAPAPLAERLRLHLDPCAKGWLPQGDLEASLARLRGLDRAAFRGHADLVAPVENAYEVLEAATTKPDHVLVLVAG